MKQEELCSLKVRSTTATDFQTQFLCLLRIFYLTVSTGLWKQDDI